MAHDHVTYSIDSNTLRFAGIAFVGYCGLLVWAANYVIREIQHTQTQVAQGILPVAEARLDAHDLAISDLSDRVKDLERRRK